MNSTRLTADSDDVTRPPIRAATTRRAQLRSARVHPDARSAASDGGENSTVGRGSQHQCSSAPRRQRRGRHIDHVRKALPCPSDPRPPHAPVTVRVARWSATHPWRAIALWLVFVAGCVAVGSVVGLREINDRRPRRRPVRARRRTGSTQAGFQAPRTPRTCWSPLAPAALDSGPGAAATAAVGDADAAPAADVAHVGAPVTAHATGRPMTLRDHTDATTADVDPLLAATPRCSDGSRRCGSKRSARSRSTTPSTTRWPTTCPPRRRSACR